MTEADADMPEQTQILYAEDDADYGAAIAEFMQVHGLKMKIVLDMPSVMAEITTRPPQVLVLDQYLKGHDASTDLGRLRQFFNGPILMLSGNTDIVDRVICLETGADDFIVKTASPREVLARLRVALRRAGDYPIRKPPETEVVHEVTRVRNEDVTIGDFILRFNRLILTYKGETCCTLTPAECDMLWRLMSNVGVLIDRDSATKDILGRRFESGQRNIDNLISRLRTKIENGGGVMHVQTIRNRGYIFDGFGTP